MVMLFLITFDMLVLQLLQRLVKTQRRILKSMIFVHGVFAYAMVLGVGILASAMNIFRLMADW